DSKHAVNLPVSRAYSHPEGNIFQNIFHIIERLRILFRLTHKFRRISQPDTERIHRERHSSAGSLHKTLLEDPEPEESFSLLFFCLSTDNLLIFLSAETPFRHINP